MPRPPLLLAALLLLAFPTLALAQPTDPWIGKRVFTQPGAVLKVGNAILDDEGRTTSGQDIKTVRVYRVEHVNGDWLWLKDENSSRAGWVRSQQVIPYEQAVDFYTAQLRAQPSASLYNRRGTIRGQRGEHDLAIADLNEAIRLEPGKALYFSNRGITRADKQEHDKAMADFTEAIRLDPKYAVAFYNRGIARLLIKEHDKAIADFTESIRLDPKDAAVFLGRGTGWGEKKEYDKAIADYNEAIRLDPEYALAFLGRGMARRDKQEYDKAIADYGEAIRLDPEYDLAFVHRGTAWLAKKEYDKAIADYNEAIRLDPKEATAFNDRGIAWRAKKAYDKAIADYNEAIRLDPNFASAFNGRAWLWATCPDAKHRDGKRAVESATRACELSGGKDAYSIDTLAAAYAESGDFANAIASQEKANKLYDDVDARNRGQQRLKLYQGKKPYRDEG